MRSLTLSEQLVVLARLAGTILQESYIEPGSETAITVDDAGHIITKRYPMNAPGCGAHGGTICWGETGTHGNGSSGITNARY